MSKNYMDGDDLIISEIPAYASNIVVKKSNGLAGELIIARDNLAFFDVTGKKVTINKKKCLEINKENRFYFDKTNLLCYMEQVKNEYISAALFDYKSFKAEPWKNVDYIGWQKRYKKIKSSEFSEKFIIYIKQTDDKDPKKGARYYLGASNSHEYSIIIKYCLIPQFTNIRIKKEENSHGGYNYIFLLEVKKLDDIQSTLEERHSANEQKYSNESQDSLFNEARDKSNLAEQNQKGATVTTKVYNRDAAVSAYVKMRADGKCDLCGENAPFNDKKGNPYLEEHHVKRLADGGADSIDNAVALCPNCHRKIHIVGTEDMNKSLLERIMVYAKLEEKFLGAE